MKRYYYDVTRNQVTLRITIIARSIKMANDCLDVFLKDTDQVSYVYEGEDPLYIEKKYEK